MRDGKFHKIVGLGTLFAHKTGVVGWPESRDSASVNGDINTDKAVYGEIFGGIVWFIEAFL